MHEDSSAEMFRSEILSALDDARLNGDLVSFRWQSEHPRGAQLRYTVGVLGLQFNSDRGAVGVYLGPAGHEEQGQYLIEDIGVALGWWCVEDTQAWNAPLTIDEILRRVSSELAAVQALFHPSIRQESRSQLIEIRRQRVSLRFG